MTVSTEPNNAVTAFAFDAGDRNIHSILPLDEAGNPERRMTYTYDKVGNLRTTTSPKGNLTPTAGDFTVTDVYDEVYQKISSRDAAGNVATYEYDNVGNVVKVVDAKKTASADPNDYTARYEYDQNHAMIKEIDAAGHSATTTLDKDGIAVRTTDQEGVSTELTLDPRAMVVQSKVPHKNVNGTITYRTTKYEFDQVGNPTKTITPRGVDTTDDAEDFAQVTVYDSSTGRSRCSTRSTRTTRVRRQAAAGLLSGAQGTDDRGDSRAARGGRPAAAGAGIRRAMAAGAA